MENKEKTLKEHCAEIGKIKTEKKSKQSALNGKLGGRPCAYTIRELTGVTSNNRQHQYTGCLVDAKKFAMAKQAYVNTVMTIENSKGDVIYYHEDGKWHKN